MHEKGSIREQRKREGQERGDSKTCRQEERMDEKGKSVGNKIHRGKKR